VTQVTNVLLVGVGGQGVLTAARILAEAAFASGFGVTQSEVHGMSQRGGSVECQVRFGQQVTSPLIPAGETDVLLALDREEVDRSLPTVRVEGTVVSPAAQLLDALPHPRTLNVALIGALSTVLPFSGRAWRSALVRVLPPRFYALNRQAFDTGRGLARLCIRQGTKGLPKDET